MADWTLISDAALDPDAPLTSDLGYAWRDNPIAISEGAANAPYARTGWHPYNSTLVGGAGTGEIWSFAANGAVATIETPDFVDGYEYKLFSEGIFGAAVSFNVTLSAFFVTSGAYVLGPTLISGLSNGVAFVFDTSTLRPRRVSLSHVTEYSAGTSSVFSQGGYFFNTSPAQKIGKVRVQVTAGNFNAGAVYLYRRRVY